MVSSAMPSPYRRESGLSGTLGQAARCCRRFEASVSRRSSPGRCAAMYRTRSSAVLVKPVAADIPRVSMWSIGRRSSEVTKPV